MGDWSLMGDGQRWTTGTVVTGTSTGPSVQTGASSHVKTAWTTLISAGNNVAQGDAMLIIATATGGADVAFDLGVGAAGSETVIADGILFNVPGIGEPTCYFLPVGCFPTGVRVAYRAQSPGGTVTVNLHASFITCGLRPSQPLQRITGYGQTVDGSNTKGTSVDPGGTTNTKGSYSQLTSSTTNAIQWGFLTFTTQQNSARTAATWLVDIATGGAGSENIIMANLLISSTASSVNPTQLGPFPLHIPAGTRVAARAQCSINDATDRTFDIQLVGID